MKSLPNSKEPVETPLAGGRPAQTRGRWALPRARSCSSSGSASQATPRCVSLTCASPTVSHRLSLRAQPVGRHHGASPSRVPLSPSLTVSHRLSLRAQPVGRHHGASPSLCLPLSTKVSRPTSSPSLCPSLCLPLGLSHCVSPCLSLRPPRRVSPTVSQSASLTASPLPALAALLGLHIQPHHPGCGARADGLPGALPPQVRVAAAAAGPRCRRAAAAASPRATQQRHRRAPHHHHEPRAAAPREGDGDVFAAAHSHR